jgi:ABC-2 type transport system permease protein
MKNKSIMTTVIALAGIALYYVVYFKAFNTIREFIANITSADISITGAMAPLYWIGRVGCGAVLPMLVVTCVVVLILVGVYFLLSKTFLKIVTTKTGASKVKYKEGKTKVRGTGKALLMKELKRITSSSTILLNCGLGSIIMIIGAVALLIKGSYLYELLTYAFGPIHGTIAVMTAGAISTISSTVSLTAFSVSLEGKSLWILRTMPVSTSQILRVKKVTDLLFTGIPGILLVIAAALTMHLGAVDILLTFVLVVLSCVLMADLGLFIDLRRTNLNWTNETALVKQSLNVFLTLLAGWIEAGLIIVAGLFLAPKLGGTAVLGILTAVFAIPLVILELWLAKKGPAAFESL